MTEAEKEKLEVAEEKKDARKDSEEMPVWAADAFKRMEDSLRSHIDDRFDSMRKDKDEGEDPTETSEGKTRKDAKKEEDCRKDEEEKKAEAEKDKKDSEKEKTAEAADRKDAEEKEKEKEKEDRARHDMQVSTENRQLKAQIAEMDKRLGKLYTEPSFEDRNAIAEARNRADSVYQALTGQPASQPLPGEPPLSYRKRLADGLRKFSDKFKNERLDSLSGTVYDEIESRIYADAQEAIRSPSIVAHGELRPITEDFMGHKRTRYVGDPRAAWERFEFGAVRDAAL
ncbi:MAG: hypothetical protein KHF84_09815, partial [Thermoplasmata archaeon]|nr:hypothetical protein [Candidatus Sysuiplasma jiujiangense]